jgi:peptidoglycan/xylan/chitin deacetylase (PgdA/CDA1 family)
MNKIYTLKSILVPLIGLISILVSCRQTQENHAGQTVVCKWQGDKRTALSLTFDDGIITQFSVARPIMNQLDFPATFFIITGKIKGSQK